MTTVNPTTAEILIATDDGAMPAYEARPAEARGAVVVVQEAFGVTSHIERVAVRLAEAGWHAVAPALFHRQGSPVLDYDDLGSVMPVMRQLTAGGLTTDLDAVLGHLEAAGHPDSRVGVVGFCMGGSVTLYAATLRPLGAAVTFYGGGLAEGRFGLPPGIELAGMIRTPWLGLYGDLDTGIPVEQVEQVRAAASRSGMPSEVVRYEAGHGFHCEDRPDHYDAAAAADGWARTLAWFDRYLAG